MKAQIGKLDCLNMKKGRFSTSFMGGPIMSLTLQLLRIPTSKHLKKIVVRLTDLTGRACSTTVEYTHFDLEVMG